MTSIRGSWIAALLVACATTSVPPRGPSPTITTAAPLPARPAARRPIAARPAAPEVAPPRCVPPALATETEQTSARRISEIRLSYTFEQLVLDDPQIASLAEVVTLLRASPRVHVEIAGHLDDREFRDYCCSRSNSEERAARVRRHLLDGGVDGVQITHRGYGPEQPIASNRSPAGRARNRRVELRAEVRIGDPCS